MLAAGFEEGIRDFESGSYRSDLAGKFFFELQTIEDRNYFHGWHYAKGRKSFLAGLQVGRGPVADDRSGPESKSD